MMDEDELRHRQEEVDRRKKRKLYKENKSESRKQKDKERQAYRQKIINEANRGKDAPRPPPPNAPRPPPPPSHHHHRKPKPPKPSSSKTTTDSKFQNLFSKRAEGFIIDMNFRNAPPRPPVGPMFVGLGLEGELNDKWTRYQDDNAIERQYVWKLHAEPDLGVPLATSAMDYEGCYFDPTKKKKKRPRREDGDGSAHAEDGEEEEEPVPLPKLHPDDAKIIDWTGDKGDSVLRELQGRRLRARAMLTPGSNGNAGVGGSATPSSSSKNAKNFPSRVLRSVQSAVNTPSFMKKTTYLANDQSKSVHDFTSLEKTKKQNAEEIRKKMEENRRKLSDKDGIEEAFRNANRAETPGAPKRKHPVKKGVTAVCEVPFLPDATTWGHTFTHVVVDHLPKRMAVRKKDGAAAGRLVRPKMLEKAFIADVTRPGESVRMECNLLLPENPTGGKEEDVLYDAAMAYDLEFVPLKEEGAPCVNFLLTIDEKNSVATYHPISSQVKLSSGRRPGGNALDRRKRLRRYVGRREMGSDDVKEMEAQMAEIDRDFKGRDADHEQEINGNVSSKSQDFGNDDDSDSDGY